VLKVVEPDETALDRLDDDTTRRSLIRSLMCCVDDGAGEASEAERAALDNAFAQQGRAPDVDPRDPPGPAWCTHEHPDRHRYRALVIPCSEAAVDPASHAPSPPTSCAATSRCRTEGRPV
jgi:hypothetical protein